MPGPFVPNFRRPVAAILTAALLAVAVCLAAPFAARPLPPAASARSERGMVVTVHTEATDIGVSVLADGGNSVDAAVASALALAVAYPMAGNLGGGGFLLYRDGEGNAYALDFREVAPRRLDGESFLDEDGVPIPGASVRSGLAVGVPGSVAGLAEAHRRWGVLPWERLVRPAQRLAERGSTVTPYLAFHLERAREQLDRDPAARRIFLADGQPPAAGDRLVQRDLAATLSRLARHGSSGFYEGKVARSIARTVQRTGGVMEKSDLSDYRPVLRSPLAGHYRGHRVLTFPPPSSGGVALLQMLQMLERHGTGAADRDAFASVHLMAEVERRAYADRARWLGDPDFVEVPLGGLLSPDYLARRARSIDPDRASSSRDILAGVPPARAVHDTLHLSTADSSGGVVSLTTTLNTAFGTGIVARGTGVLLNNEMDDFALASGAPNTWGLVGARANSVEPGKRPLSSMTPTIVESANGGAAALVLGSPGGGAIITSVLQVLVNVLGHGMPLDRAVEAPRFHHQWLPDTIRHESDAFSPEVAAALRTLGHALTQSPQRLGNVNAIGVDGKGGWVGVADPRRGGTAGGP